MTSNPFVGPTQFIDDEPTEYEPPFDDLSDNHIRPAGPAIRSPQSEKRFFKRIGFAVIGFLLMVFVVFREMQHSRELFRMNRLLLEADAQLRQSQERERMYEAREACLTAELLSLQSVSRGVQVEAVSYPVGRPAAGGFFRAGDYLSATPP